MTFLVHCSCIMYVAVINDVKVISNSYIVCYVCSLINAVKAENWGQLSYRWCTYIPGVSLVCLNKLAEIWHGNWWAWYNHITFEKKSSFSISWRIILQTVVMCLKYFPEWPYLGSIHTFWPFVILELHISLGFCVIDQQDVADDYMF